MLLAQQLQAGCAELARVLEFGQSEQVLLVVVPRNLLDEQLLLGRRLGRDETVVCTESLDLVGVQVRGMLDARIVEQSDKVCLRLK